MKKAALLSVSDRTGLLDFAKNLRDLGYLLLGSSGTRKALMEGGLDCLSIEEYTGQKEILGGRVKTLHPKIYAGILARRDVPGDLEELEKNQILQIDVVAVNLYPFSANRVGSSSASQKKTLSEMIELVDIGGPSMIRATAKNHRYVWPAIDPADYNTIISAIKNPDPVRDSVLRHKLATKVFAVLSRDSLDIAEYFSAQDLQPEITKDNKTGPECSALSYSSSILKSTPSKDFPNVLGQVLVKSQSLRYGENSHQKASFYYGVEVQNKPWEQFWGKELSYNNILDLDAVIKLVNALPKEEAGCVIVKHTNPCGVAIAEKILSALVLAKKCDPRSHFGGIIGFSRKVDSATAAQIREDFAEIVVAPAFDQDAEDILKSSKNLRLIRISDSTGSDTYKEMRSALGGVLIQEADLSSSLVAEAELVSKRPANQAELRDLDLAWRICPHVKSNSIVLVKDGLLIGVGAGQMSRIDSVELALSKAKIHGHDLTKSVAASDAFFPFPDSVETLAKEGITAVIAPKGAKRDAETIEQADKHNVALLFAADRHFRH